MWKRREEIQIAELLCFYTKKDAETSSLYEAQLWKCHSIPVYVRLKRMDGSILEALVKQIHFNYRHKPCITVKTNQFSKKFELINVICDIRVLEYHELYFFHHSNSNPLNFVEASNNIVDITNKETFEQEYEKAMEKGESIAILYVENSYYSGITRGIIPDVEQYDDQLQLITTKHQKIFLLEKR